MNRAIRLMLALALAVLALPSTLAVAQEPVEVVYWLWDANQLPPYRACGDLFQESHPDITIKIEQFGWDDYWATLQTTFVTGDAPDVFTNQLSKHPEFVNLGQEMDIAPLIERDNVPTDIYIEGLFELWTKDDAIYGLPKDWDTVAVVYNVEMFEAAGIDPAIMETWDWNPVDGGTFEQVIAQLTLDANGNNGLSPDFDKDNVVQWGFISRGASNAGQTEWSHWAVSNGFQHTNGIWGDEYYYDDPRLIETFQWYADLALVKGYAPSFAEVDSLGPQALFSAERGAMTTDGSWMINSYVHDSDFEVGFGLLPIGPEGRKSMFNGLADGIWVGTQHPEEAWEWFKFLASPDCLNIVGDSGVVFPATPESTERSLAAHEEQGVDVSAYVDEALDPEGTFLYPITDHGSEITRILEETFDLILIGETTAAEALPRANEQVNALFD
ncbi:MAG: sugar ABC transporter substrate-binding protein [Anaerolineae bacterium]|nr:sugar ABC transporter substrate-binding protein [Anaerolineae bacterium]